MKVLYVVWNYPKISETYITAEIKYMLRAGVEVRVWSPVDGGQGMKPDVPVYRGDPVEAYRDFRPDIVHAHYLVSHQDTLLKLGEIGARITIRAHSFDFSTLNVAAATNKHFVRRIYLFPHFAQRLIPDPKILPLPVAFDSKVYGPKVTTKDRSLVLRAAAALPSKGLLDFFRTARLCSDHSFVLLVNVIHPHFAIQLQRLAESHSDVVEVYWDVTNTEAATWTKRAGIYLDTSDPDEHEFGMPISIAEAMATGAHVLAREHAFEYLGGAGQLYTSPEMAAYWINRTSTWTEDRWRAAEALAVARAQAFTDTAILGRMLEDWKEINS